MNRSKQELKRLEDYFSRGLKKAGLKATPQRSEVFSELARTLDHPDVETVYQGVRKKMPAISLDTVYRTLRLLAEIGLIETVGLSREKTRFDADVGSHHHFVCKECGSIIDFRNDEFDRLGTPDEVSRIGRPERIHVQVKGICQGCLDRRPLKKNRCF